jgi:hypothetical protein
VSWNENAYADVGGPGNIDKIKHYTSCNESSARFIRKIKGKKVPSFVL